MTRSTSILVGIQLLYEVMGKMLDEMEQRYKDCPTEEPQRERWLEQESVRLHASKVALWADLHQHAWGS